MYSFYTFNSFDSGDRQMTSTMTRDPTDPILDTASHRIGREVDGM